MGKDVIEEFIRIWCKAIRSSHKNKMHYGYMDSISIRVLKMKILAGTRNINFSSCPNVSTVNLCNGGFLIIYGTVYMYRQLPCLLFKCFIHQSVPNGRKEYLKELISIFLMIFLFSFDAFLVYHFPKFRFCILLHT